MKRWLLVFLLLLAPARADGPVEELVGVLTDMGAYVSVTRMLQARLPELERQTLAGQVALPAEQRWMLPAEALPALLQVRLNAPAGDYTLVDALAVQARQLGLAEQELALRALAVRLADRADLPLEVRRRLPDALELADRVKTQRGKILAFQLVSTDFFYNQLPAHPDLSPEVWARSYQRASDLLPREPLQPQVLNRSFGLWLGFEECQADWLARVVQADVKGAPLQALLQDVQWLSQQVTTGLKLDRPALEPTFAYLWLSLKVGSMGQPATLEQAGKTLQQMRTQFKPIEAELAKRGLTDCLDELDGLEAYFLLLRGQKEGLQRGARLVTNYAAPWLCVELAQRLAPHASEQQLLPFLDLPSLTRVHRSLLLTALAEVALREQKPDQARAYLFEARAMQLEYLADLGAGSRLDGLFFKKTIELSRQLQK